MVFMMCLFFINFKKGLAFYIICTFVAPAFALGSMRIAFDIIVFPILFIAYLLYRRFRFEIAFSAFLPYVVVYLFSLIIGIVFFDAVFSIINLYAILRCIVVINMMLNVWMDDLNQYIEKILSSVIIINVVFCVLQMTNLVSVQFFYDLYFRTSMVPLQTQLEIGHFDRAYGANASPVIMGGIAAISFAYFWGSYIAKSANTKHPLFIAVLCACCGLAALSKTAILAIPIVMIFVLLWRALFTPHYKPRMSASSAIKIPLFILVGGATLLTLISWLRSKGYFIDYYLAYLTDPFKALSTRYDSSSGILSQTIQVVKDNFLFGVGEAQVNNAFIGDSTYIVLLYQTGIIGLVVFLVPFIFNFLSSYNQNRMVECCVILAFLLVGIGSSLSFVYYMTPFYAFLFNKRKEKTKEEMGILLSKRTEA